MLNIELYKNSWLFQSKKLNPWDLVFLEWEIDENLYIVLSWEIIIEKYTSNEKIEKKELAILKQNDFFWEWWLSNNFPKEVSARAKNETHLIYINWKKWIQTFMIKYPYECLNLLIYIINLTNKRLLDANKQITDNYEIVKIITEIKNINDKNIFETIEKIKTISWFNHILFFETNQVISEYTTLKYDTKEPWKIKDITVLVQDINNINLLKENIEIEDETFIQKLNIWELDLWFMIFWKKEKFTYEDKKLIISITNNLTGLLKQKQILKEELNKKYMKEKNL